ncbi:MAG TPA: hypothetical protein VGD23_08625 [Sphingomicrobium sp.]
MRTSMFLTIAAALTVSAPLAAKTETSANQLAENKSGKAEGEKKICKRLATSGTRMADRVCLTKEQWKKVDEETNG